jgi:U6 snRNA-associated Sm-like protein LSm8
MMGDSEIVCVITCDARFIVGKMIGYDQLQNLVLKDATERVYLNSQVDIVPLGLYIIRGDNVAVISGEFDENLLEKHEKEGISSTVQSLKPVVQYTL